MKRVDNPSDELRLEWIRDSIEEAKKIVYRPHCMTYGKLMESNDPNGRTVRHFEHQLTAATEDFPQELLPYCSELVLFPGWIGTKASIKAPLYGNAAFSLKSVVTETGKAYHLFCRICPWSEDGGDAKSRTFTHFNIWAFDIDAFHILAVWPVMQALFIPDEKDSTYIFTHPATKDMGDLMNIKRPYFTLEDELGVWNFWYDILTEKLTARDLIDAMKEVILYQGGSDEIDDEALFIARTLDCICKKLSSYREDPRSLEFTLGVAQSTDIKSVG